jgi:Leu/Phe-tRNA-protein transferase
LDDQIHELRLGDFEGPAWPAIVADTEHTYYWSDRFEPEYYRAQARAGCIAVAARLGGRALLLPELQAAYAVLDWDNLHQSRSLKRLFRSGRLEAIEARLRLNSDPGPVLRALDERWGEGSWLTPEYRGLMLALAAESSPDFRLWGAELMVKGSPEPVAGELGYVIGRTYTSLSGFFRRERPEWSGLGIVQLHLLAQRLRDRGFAFWNLGHPYMRYKIDMGARILPRTEFLERWAGAARGHALSPE